MPSGYGQFIYIYIYILQISFLYLVCKLFKFKNNLMFFNNKSSESDRAYYIINNLCLENLDILIKI